MMEPKEYKLSVSHPLKNLGERMLRSFFSYKEDKYRKIDKTKL